MRITPARLVTAALALLVAAGSALYLASSGEPPMQPAGDAVAAPGTSSPTNGSDLVPVCGVAENVTFCVTGEAADALRAAFGILDSKGPADALSYLDEQLRSQVSWVDQCHQMIHILGHESARRYPMPEVLAIDNRMCQDGYLDGAMEGFADYSDDETFWDGVRTLCVPFVGHSWKASSCGHGMGHALAYRGNLDYKKAVEFCDLVPVDARMSCAGGLIMGITNPADGSGVTAAGGRKRSELPLEEIDATCDGIRGEYAQPCLSILWTLYPDTMTAEQLLPRLARICAASALPSACFDGYGQSLYKLTLRSIEDRGETPEAVRAAGIAMAKQCGGAGEWEQYCVQGVAYSAGMWWTTLTSSFDGYLSMCDALRQDVRRMCLLSEDTHRKGYSEEGDPSSNQAPAAGA